MFAKKKDSLTSLQPLLFRRAHQLEDRGWRLVRQQLRRSSPKVIETASWDGMWLVGRESVDIRLGKVQGIGRLSRREYRVE